MSEERRLSWIQRQLRAVPLQVWMVLIALALRTALIPFDSIENLMDAQHLHAWEQGNVARSLVAGHGFGSPFLSSQLSAIMPPVYPLIVAAIFILFGVHTAHAIFAVHVFDCIVNSLAVVPIFLFARRGFGERVAKWAAWMWVFSPYGIYFSAAWAWSTHLLILALCWLFYLAQAMDASPRLRLWAGFGLLAGFAGLTEPTSLVVAAFLMLLAAWRLARGGRQWVLPFCTAALVAALVISPWIVRNAVVFHRFIPMRDSMGLEVWMGNNGYTTRFTSDQLHPLHDARELADYNRMGELAYMANKGAEARAYIDAHPAWYAWMCFRRAVYLWTGYWSFSRAYLAMEPTDVFNVPFDTARLLLAMVGLWFAFRRRLPDAMRYAGALFVFPVIYYFSHPEPYHMRAVDPLLLTLCVYGVFELMARFGKKYAAPAAAA